MIDQVTQKCVVVRSRTQQPFFQIVSRQLSYKRSQDALVKNLCFSVDPVMKFFLAGAQTYFNKVQVGSIFNCFALGIVISGNSDYEEGKYIFGNIGTCDVNIMDEQRQRECFQVPTHLVKKFGQLQFLYLVNNGLAAYAGYQIMSPKSGQNVVVSTASGATGILLCQLLRKKGANVIGLTSQSKISFLQNYVKIAVDYKDQQKMRQIFKENKFKYYFDNVGQSLLDTIIQYIEIQGKIALCGAIANYDNYSNRGLKNVGAIISKRLTLTGLTFMGVFPKIQEIFQEYEGIKLNISSIKMDQFQKTFVDLLKSGNNIIGKVIVKI